MDVIICLDQKNGRLFNSRRQSSDRKIREHVLANLGNRKLWLDSYSAKQFVDYEDSLVVDDDFSSHMGDEDICFLERGEMPRVGNIKRLIVYRWDKTYPSDVSLDETVFRSFSYALQGSFPGYSHDKIFWEVYCK